MRNVDTRCNADYAISGNNCERSSVLRVREISAGRQYIKAICVRRMRLQQRCRQKRTVLRMMDVSEAHGLRPQAQAPTHDAAAQHMSPYADKFI